VLELVSKLLGHVSRVLELISKLLGLITSVLGLVYLMLIPIYSAVEIISKVVTNIRRSQFPDCKT
jgi:uncharacterized membrane protein